LISAGSLKLRAFVYRAPRSSLGHFGTFVPLLTSFRCSLREAGAVELTESGGVAVVRQVALAARFNDFTASGCKASDRLLIAGVFYRLLGFEDVAGLRRRMNISAVEVDRA
jgi:hypothetical protein